MISFGSYIVKNKRWTEWKALQASKVLRTQHDEDSQTYLVYGYDGPEVITCDIWKGTVPDSIQGYYSQAQNDADKADWEANYKPLSNGPIESRTKDGRVEVRHTTVRRLQNFNLRAFSFYTAQSGSLHNVNPVTESDWGDITYTMYNSSGGVVTNVLLQGTVVKTVVDFEPHYDYEIVGGYADFPDSLLGGSTDDWYVGSVGIPDLPSSSFGSIPYLSEVNIEAVQDRRVTSDGRATSFLPYKYGGYPTNKIRFYIKHPAGAQKRFQIYLEHFT